MKARNQFPLSVEVATLGLPARPGEPARHWWVAAQEPTKASAPPGTTSHTIPARHERLEPVQSMDLPKVMSAPTNGKEPLIASHLVLAHGKTVDTEQKPAERPRKSQQSAEKPAESRSTSSQRLAEPPPRGNPKCVDSERQAGDASVNTIHRGLYGMQSETCPGQTKTANSSESKDRPAVEIKVAASKPEVLPLPESEAAAHYASTVINHLPEMGQLSRAAALEGGSHVTTSISQQITVSVEGSLRQGDTHLTIYLNPPELGKVSVRFQQQHEQITILLEVSRPETRREIELTLPQIMRSLQDCGVQIGRLEVSAPRGADELQQQPDAGALGQDHSEMTQHHSSAFGDPQRGVPSAALDHDNGSVHEWLTSTAGDRYPDDLTSQMVYTSGSINVLM